MSRHLKLVSLLLPLILLRAAFAEELIQVPAAIHIASTVSGGKYSITEIASLARANGIKVLMITDALLNRWEYGVWPLRNIVRKRVEQKSVLTYGVRHYLDDIKRAQALYADVLLIPGVEAAPFYYWTGSVIEKNLKMHNWHKHLLVIGLENAADYERLPVIGNSGGGRRLFDQYHSDQCLKPYQELLGYVKAKGGLTFWAHPEAANVAREGAIGIETPGHASDLIYAQGYTGFCVFYEGYKELGYPGGMWDDILKAYCAGTRSSPVWVIGGLGFESTGDLAQAFKDLRTILLVHGSSFQEALQALKTGKMYVMKGRLSEQFTLDNFLVRDTVKHIAKTMGETLSTNGKPLIEISGHFSGKAEETLEIKLIRNGSIIRTFSASSPFHIFYTDQSDSHPGCRYYRVEITSPSLTLVSNPVFVKSP